MVNRKKNLAGRAYPAAVDRFIRQVEKDKRKNESLQAVSVTPLHEAPAIIPLSTLVKGLRKRTIKGREYDCNEAGHLIWQTTSGRIVTVMKGSVLGKSGRPLKDQRGTIKISFSVDAHGQVLHGSLRFHTKDKKSRAVDPNHDPTNAERVLSSIKVILNGEKPEKPVEIKLSQ